MRSPRRRRLAIAVAIAVVCLLGGAAAGDAAAGLSAQRAAVDLSGAAGDQDGLGDGAVDLGGGSESRAVGTVNPLAVRNPLCDEGLQRPQRRNCRTTGTPEGRYPSSNYGFDVHIDTGVDNISGNFASMLAQIANAIWTFCLFILNIVLTVLGWAFALSPFSDNSTLSEVDQGLQRFYRAFTEPWMVAAMVAVGAWALYRGIVRREVAATLAGTLLTLAMMLVGLWVIFEPRATIGTVTEYTNDAALSALAAPQAGSISDPVGDYGEATDEVWRTMTLPAFSVLNFSNVDWALSKPDPELLATSNTYACADAAYLAQLPPNRVDEIVFGSEHTGGVAGVGGSEHTTCENLGELVPSPRSNAEIWLRNSPGSLARERLWDQHTDDAPYSSYFAIQGEGGAGTRFPLTLLIAAGLLGGILLLAWLAMRIFVQTAVAFVLVLTTPVALFMPASGESGRRAFATWGAALLGALVSKLVYAALLSVVLFATTVVAGLVHGGGGIGATMGLLVMAALWWAVFLKRESILAFISISRQEGESRLGSMLGLYAASRVGRQMLSPVAGTAAGGARRARDGIVGSGEDRRRAIGSVARDQLEDRGAERLDAKLASEEGFLADQSARRDQLTGVEREYTAARKEARRHQHAAATAPDPTVRERHEKAREAALEHAQAARQRQRTLRGELTQGAAREAQASAFVAAAREREQTTGRRWAPAQLAETREAIRREADRPACDPAHAWRAGMTPERYNTLEGAERERIHGAVEGQLRSDRRAFGAIPDRPAGLKGWRAGRRYRRWEVPRRPGGEHTLHRARIAATRRRRAAHRRARRGVSR
jgi:hypothetical protein